MNLATREQAEQSVKNIPAYHQRAMNELSVKRVMSDAATLSPDIQDDRLRRQAAEELTFYVVKNELLNAFMPVTDIECFDSLLEAFVAATDKRNNGLTTMYMQLRRVIEEEQPATFDQLQHLLRRLTLAYEGSTPVDSSTVERMVLIGTLELVNSLTEAKDLSRS